MPSEHFLRIQFFSKKIWPSLTPIQFPSSTDPIFPREVSSNFISDKKLNQDGEVSCHHRRWSLTSPALHHRQRPSHLGLHWCPGFRWRHSDDSPGLTSSNQLTWPAHWENLISGSWFHPAGPLRHLPRLHHLPLLCLSALHLLCRSRCHHQWVSFSI